MPIVPIWIWLPGQDSPVHAADLSVDRGSSTFRYRGDYLERADAVVPDPVELRPTRSMRGLTIRGTDGLPGIVRDAKPAGYGADRLIAQAGTELNAIELLERGVPDGVGAIEACVDIARKLAWRPRTLDELRPLAEELDAAAPSSRALRRLNEDLATSAGGERPKTTLMHDGRLWLAKMQDRGDRPALPAREFVTMELARVVGLDVAAVRLHSFGTHQVLLVERFDRSGDPLRPTRTLYASAHTVLRLPLDAIRGNVQRSYLVFGDQLRVWGRGRDDLGAQLRELWRRMVFNALVGNIDDHPLNHGLIHDGSRENGWRLSPAFDITPASATVPQPLENGPALAMATGKDGSALTGAKRLIDAAAHFGVDIDEAARWIADTSRLVANRWEPMLRQAAAPITEDAARMDHIVTDARRAFCYSEWLADHA